MCNYIFVQHSVSPTKTSLKQAHLILIFSMIYIMSGFSIKIKYDFFYLISFYRTKVKRKVNPNLGFIGSVVLLLYCISFMAYIPTVLEK